MHIAERHAITHGTSILPMVTVMLAPGPGRAESQGCLIPPTPEIVQDDGSSPLPKEGAPWGGQGAPAAQLPAGNGGITKVPSIVTHRPPASAVPNLQAASAAVGTISKAQPRCRTSADQPCILRVVAVAPAPGASGTVPEGLLSSSTPHIVHPHRSCTRSESGTPGGGQRSPASQLPTGHCCISEVPPVIAHGSPAAAMPDFQAAGTSMGTGDQAQALLAGSSICQYRGPRRLGLLGWPGVLLAGAILGVRCWLGSVSHGGLL